MRDSKNINGESMPYQLNQLEKTVINSLEDIIAEKATKVQEKAFIDLLNKYYICILTGDYLLSCRIDSIKRFLLFLLIYPVKNKIDADRIIRIYSRYWLLDMVTFFVFQLTDETINQMLIEKFLSICTGYERNLSIIFLYRVNQDYIRQNYEVSIDDLTPKEIYYGISSGYYSERNIKEAAIRKLISLNNEKELNILKTDGLWIID